MKSVELLTKEHAVDKFYKYGENKLGKKIEFGWVSWTPELKDDISPAILATSAEDNSGTEDEKNHSLAEGNSLTSLLDYRKYFEALTSSTPEELLRIWNNREVDFSKYWISKQSNYTAAHAMFVLNVAHLIVDGKKFTQFGRTFKLV